MKTLRLRLAALAALAAAFTLVAQTPAPPATDAASTNRHKGPEENKVLSPGPDDAQIGKVVALLLERQHYAQKPLDNELSRKFLDRYLDALDPGHLVFLQSDEEEFSDKWATRLDDLTKRAGNLSPGTIIFNRFMGNFQRQVEYVTNLLASEKFEFDGDERHLVNRREAARPADLPAAKKLWRERVRFEYLQEKLSKQKPQEIVEKLSKRYTRQLRFLRDWDSDDVIQLYLSSLGHVYDPHTDYMGKPTYDNFSINMRLSLFGIGATLQSEDGYCKISALHPASPAEKSRQLKVNDKIVGVAQGTNEFVDVVDLKLTKVVEQIRGDKGTLVRLKVWPGDATDSSIRKEVSIIRDEIKLEDSEAKARILDLPAGGGKTNRVGYLDLPSFYADLGNRKVGRKSTTDDVARLLKKLMAEKVSGVILDLRRNGGGSLEESIRLTGLFIKQGPVVQVKDGDGTITVDEDKDSGVLYDGPLVVLTSRFSASASEILAGALQDYGRALIVGDATTHGKGTVQSVLDLDRILKGVENPGAVKLTIRKFYRAAGSSTQLKGVVPDIILPSVNNHAEVGEGAIPGALEWDTVPAAKFEPVNIVPPFIEDLRSRSTARVARDRDFEWMRGEIERFKKVKEDKTVSLNEQKRLKEKREAEARAEARKKDLKSRPEPAHVTYEITLKNVDDKGMPAPFKPTNTVAKAESPAPAAETKKSSSADDEEEEKDEGITPVDFTLDETRHILLDLVELMRKKNGVAVAK